MHAAGRGNPAINLSDGREIVTGYEGPAELVQILERNQAQPLAMASADFDEDGVPDLIIGYAGAGSGIISLLRGNVDAIYPNSPEAQARKAAGMFTDAPFLSPAPAFAVPHSPDFIGAGDFDGDGHWDVVTAERGGDKLCFLLGNGRGDLGSLREIALPGGVTAMVVGEINRRDGLDDVVIGISGDVEAQALVFEGPKGALRALPESFSLPVAATALALGQFDDESEMDLAVVAGQEMMVVHGRDRRLSLDQRNRAEIGPARVSRRSLPFTAKAMTLGNFSRRQEKDLALLSEDGAIYWLSAGEQAADGKRWRAERTGIEHWALSRPDGGYWPGATGLFCARVSIAGGDDLLVLDSSGRVLHVISRNDLRAERTRAETIRDARTQREAISLESEAAPVAALRMRLNAHARDSLVVIQRGHSRPSVVLPQVGKTFTVNTADDHDDGACDIVDCTLREAIKAANANDGADLIVFNIVIERKTSTPAITPTLPLPMAAEIASPPRGASPVAINLREPLPEITDPVTIDGTTQPRFAGRPLIQLIGGGLLLIQNSSTIKALVLPGVTLITTIQTQGGAGNNIIEGNYIGTDATGSAIAPGGAGILIRNSENNIVGGSAIPARNVISGSQGNGIEIPRSPTLIEGNFIGTDASGSAALPNQNGGIVMGEGASGASNITIRRNVISGNIGVGISANASRNIVIEGNFIGTDSTGTGKVPNGRGISFRNVTGEVGGASVQTRNIISGNLEDGIFIGFSAGLLIQGNFIGAGSSGAEDIGNTRHGVSFFDGSSAGSLIVDNRIAFNGGAGIRIPFDQLGSSPRLNSFLSNTIFSNTGQGIDLGFEGPTPNDDQDPDKGPNDLQNFPELKEAISDGNRTIIQGKLNSVPGQAFIIQFYLNIVNPASANFAAGEPCKANDQVLVGELKDVMTDDDGNRSFTVSFPRSGIGGFVNATATSASGADAGNTSEFSECKVVQSADLGVNILAAGDVLGGNDLTYCVTAANGGPSAANAVSLNVQLPAGTTLKSYRQVSSCQSTTPVDEWKPQVNGLNVRFTTGSFAAGATAYFKMVVTVNSRAPDDFLVCNAEISSDPETSPPDPNPDNNRSISRVKFVPPVDLSITLEDSPKNVFEDEEITYTAGVKNAGPSVAEDVEVKIEIPVGATLRSSVGASGWLRTDQTVAGGRGVIVYVIDRMAPADAASAVFKVVVKVDRELPNKKLPGVIVNTASISSAIPDRKPGDNSAMTMTKVAARPPGPIIQEITVSSDSITATGIGFANGVQVAIDDVSFESPALVEEGRKIIQRGKLANGKTIAEAIPPGKTVTMQYRNPDGGRIIVSFRN